MKRKEDIRKIVREKYGEIAEGQRQSCCGPSSCCSPQVPANFQMAKLIGYSDEQLAAVPVGANLGLGCGNPLEHANVQSGETVLDLGSGAGIDVFLAARAVGEKGCVIGVDMTPSMIERARRNCEEAGIQNVEFRLGEIEHLPVADNSIDVIISNCVINLSPEKAQVFAETFRVLKPGGRLIVSDLVLKQKLSERLRNDVSAYVGCIAGASMKEEYLELIRAAKFEKMEVVSENSYDAGLDMVETSLRDEAMRAVLSVKVRAFKPLR
jgi:ubiquinone/menaquinone biosynthesis C-methylase UbiE